MTDAELRRLVEKLEFLVSLGHEKNGGPYQGHAAASCVDAMEKASKAILSLIKRVEEAEALRDAVESYAKEEAEARAGIPAAKKEKQR